MADDAKTSDTKTSDVTVGEDVLYVMTDGATVRPAKVVEVHADAVHAGAVTLAIFTAGTRDRGLIEHRERLAFEGTGQEPPVVTRIGVRRDESVTTEAHAFAVGHGGRCARCGDPSRQTHPKLTPYKPHTWRKPSAPPPAATNVDPAQTPSKSSEGSSSGSSSSSSASGTAPTMPAPSEPATSEPSEPKAN